MFIKKSKFEKLMKNIDHLNEVLTRNQVIDLVEILGDRKKLLVRNFFSGIAKGVGYLILSIFSPPPPLLPPF